MCEATDSLRCPMVEPGDYMVIGKVSQDPNCYWVGLRPTVAPRMSTLQERGLVLCSECRR